MAAQAGKDFLLKMDDGAGNYTTVGGLRASQMKLNGEVIDITNQGSAQFKEILDGAGIISMSLSGSGVFTNDAMIQRVRTQFMARALNNFQISDGINTYTAKFKIASLDRSGEFNKEQSYSLSLESSGAITIV